MPSDSASLARRWFEEVWNRKNVGAISEMLAADGIVHGLGEDGRDLPGPEGFRLFHEKFVGAFPDIRITVNDVVAEGERCAVRFTCEGTHRGGQLGLPPTNRRVRFTAMAFMRVRNGQIVEGWNEIDGVGLMQQLTGPAPAKLFA